MIEKDRRLTPDLPRAGFLLLAALTLFWGLNWPAMKLVLNEIPVWPFRTICVTAGGLGLLLITRMAGQSIRVPRAEIRPLLLCCLFNVVGWHLLTGYGLSLIEAGRAAIIAFTMPLWAALLSALWLREPLTWRILAGLALGMLGLAVLIGSELVILTTAPLGSLFMLGAAVSWAVGTVATKAFSWSISTGTLVSWQLILGAVPIGIGTLLVGDLPAWSEVSATALLALLYVIALPMLFCQWAYFSVVRLFPATIAAIGTLAIPVVGVLSSALVLGEAITLQEVSALVLVCAALGLVLLPATRR